MKKQKNIIEPGEEIPSEIGAKKKKSQLEIFLKENERDHYNFYTPTFYKISTGSLRLDSALDGGLTPGIHRFGGSSEGGKTSEALEVIGNFLETIPNSKGLIVKAEGRLGDKIKKRSSIKFVENAEDWVAGTCFVLKSNVYDTVAQFIYDLVQQNEEDFKYIFLIDSLDGLMLKADMQKSIAGDESVKVCGPNVLTKLLFKKLSLPMSELGHMMIVITQIIAKIQVGGHGGQAPEQLSISGGGGNAAIHFSNFILTFLPRYKKHLITSDGKDPNFKFSECNIIGHKVRVALEKTENEKSKTEVEYPVKYATETDVGGIWTELEIKDSLISYGFLNFKGAWGGFSDLAKEKMALAGITNIPEKFHGEAKFNEYVSQPQVLTFWKEALRKRIVEKDVL